MSYVYVIDPQHITRAGIVAVLQNHHQTFKLAGAASGSNVLEEVLNIRPEVLLLDLPLLGAAGLELVEEIRVRLPDTKVVVLTECEEEQAMKEALNLGSNGYVLKNAGIDMLLGALNAVSLGATWIDAALAKRAFTVAGCMSSTTRNPSTCASNFAEPQAQQTRSNQYNQLSQREKEVAYLLAQGMPNREIASTLCVTVDTVKTHVRHICEKLDANSRTDAAIKAMKAGLCEAPLCMAS